MIELNSIELECRLLMLLIEIQDTFDKYSNRLNIDLFHYEQNKVIFNAITRIKNENVTQDLDIDLVIDELKSTNQFEKIGGNEYLSRLLQTIGLSSLDTISAIIDRLQDYHTKRIINEASQSAIQQLLNGDDSDDVANRLVDSVNNTQRTNKKIVLHTPRTMLSNMIERIKSYQTEGSPYFDVGFAELTFKLGLVEGNLFVIAGRPSMGKTTLAMNIVTTMAKNIPLKTALVFSLEMKADEIFDRMVSAEGEISLASIRGGAIPTEDEWGRISNVADKVVDYPIVVIDEPELTIQNIRAECQRVKRETKTNLSVIMIDHLSKMGGIGVDRVNDIGKITDACKSMAKEHNCPVILLSQLNRSLEGRPNKRPVASDLRDSGTIEQDADIIAMIYRDEVYNENTDEKGMAEINVVKNRNGKIGMVKLKFEGDYVRFSDNIPNQNISSFDE